MMGGMGGGMMGGMGGGMGGMGGGMRSVPPTDLPFAQLNPGQTRSLPTRLVSLSPPDPELGAVKLSEKGEAFSSATSPIPATAPKFRRRSSGWPPRWLLHRSANW